jgi:hypothetical protein
MPFLCFTVGSLNECGQDGFDALLSQSGKDLSPNQLVPCAERTESTTLRLKGQAPAFNHPQIGISDGFGSGLRAGMIQLENGRPQLPQWAS